MKAFAMKAEVSNIILTGDSSPSDAVPLGAASNSDSRFNLSLPTEGEKNRHCRRFFLHCYFTHIPCAGTFFHVDLTLTCTAERNDLTSVGFQRIKITVEGSEVQTRKPARRAQRQFYLRNAALFESMQSREVKVKFGGQRCFSSHVD